jgi:hypothetical protein
MATGFTTRRCEEDSSPCLFRTCELPENEKDKDRNQISSYPGIVAVAGLRITYAG